MAQLSDSGSEVHQLFWDATNIDTGASEAPSRALGRRFDKVGKANLDSILCSLFGTSKATGASSDNEIVEFFFDFHQNINL